MKRNDKWLVLHPYLLLKSWQANIEIQIVVDKGKVFRYLTKYITKLEIVMICGIASLIHNNLR